MNAPVRGLNAVLGRLDRLSMNRIGKKLGLALLDVANAIEIDAELSIESNDKHGRIYKTGRVRKNHQASAPGEAPAEDTGDLSNNIVSSMTGPLRAQVVSESRHSAALEHGTSKMAARPFMAPAVLKNKDLLRKNVETVLRQVNS